MTQKINNQLPFLALDIETKCGLAGCEDTQCDHALDPWKCAITLVAVSDGIQSKVYTRLEDVWNEVIEPSRESGTPIIGHNLKFDIQCLSVAFKRMGKTIKYSTDLCEWGDDTLLMATAALHKIPQEWLAEYESQRQALIKAGHKHHRSAKHHSLKTLAPYFLGVEPFWETADHSDHGYAEKDARYTARLYVVLKDLLELEGTYTFYKTKLLPYTKLLCDMEWRGVMVDNELLAERAAATAELSTQLSKQLDEAWTPHYARYKEKVLVELRQEYEEKALAAIAKSKDVEKTKARYNALYERAAAKANTAFNPDSPSQLSWLFKECLNLDITTFSGDESTGKSVLKRLEGEGHKDIKLFLDYREQRKLATAFFPSYRAMQDEAGVIHCTFNAHTTRTGRLSSSNPNLQQVPGHLHALFMARPGHVFITKDMSAIEPRLIAYYSEDLTLYDILKTGQDFHGYNTKIFFDLSCEVSEVKHLYPHERKLGKEVGLALMYGAGPRRLQECAQKYGFVWTEKECRRKVDKFKEAYSGVYMFRDQLNQLLYDSPMPNIVGRQFRIADPADIHMQGLNTLIQSSASDLVLDSAYRAQMAYNKSRIQAHVVLLVHDEIVVEAPKDAQEEAASILDTEMTRTPLPTPYGNIELLVEGKVADRWEK